MKESERIYRQHQKGGDLNGTVSHNRALANFRQAQCDFDKTLKHKKRDFCNGRMLHMEKACEVDPTAFWNYVSKLGPSKKQTIP